MEWLRQISPRIRLCGNGHFGKGIINPGRVICDHEYFVFEEGHGALVIDGVTYQCPERSFIIIPSGIQHISYAYSDTVLLRWGHFDWTPITYPNDPVTFYEPISPDPNLFRSAPEFIPDGVLHGSVSDPLVFVLLRQLEMRMKSEDEFERMLLSPIVLELFLRLLYSRKISKGASGKISFYYAEEVRLRLTKFANESVLDASPLEEVLRIDGYSYSRQERLFKEEFGITPHQYVTILRVERIRQLLKEGRMTVSQIADEMGFNDLAYFSRYVKKHLGGSPRRMRDILIQNKSGTG